MKIKKTLGILFATLALSLNASAQTPGNTTDKDAEILQKAQANPKDAEAQVELAEHYYNTYKDELAIEAWQKAIALKPKDPANAYYKMSQSYRYLKKFDDALVAALKAVELQPSNDTYLNGAGNIYYETSKFDAALDYYNKAVAFKSDYGIYHNNLAKAYLGKNLTNEARQSAQKALSLKSDDAVAHYLLGKADLSEKKYESAIGHFHTALTYDPKSYDTYYDQGIAYYYLKDYAQAEASFRQALSINTDPSQRLHYWMGLSLVFQKDNTKINEGVEYLKQQVAFDPKDIDAHSLLGFAYWRLGKFQEATDQYLQVMKDRYNDADTNYYLGSSYMGAGSYNLAADYLKKAVDLDNNFYAALAELGFTYYKQGKYAEALKTLNQALTVTPKEMITYAERFNPPDIVHYRIALVHLDEKHFTDCVIETDKAIALYAEDDLFYAVKGACLLGNEKAPEALEQLKKAIGMNPEREYSNYFIARAYLKVNDTASATKHYEYLRQVKSDYATKLQPFLTSSTGQSF